MRIIAGQWRGRKLPVADVPGLRPSGDRARETLFNWLAPDLPGAVCADLFAGTGALGFEAASRGARQVELVENNRLAIQNLERCIEMLGAEQVSVKPMDAMAWLRSPTEPVFDLLFADPPFDSELHQHIAQAVSDAGCLKPGGLLYIESPADAPSPVVPQGWSAWKEKRIGEVKMLVLKSGG
ncbi:MAG: 16S rRNA (guanine(966)-N(2))-methyltransferase RsmD [Xanthomonadales bacterium]|nr:16S rRNA (guanine(966)-N(2))-methyltransferase RsmD [Xanthomonadales bacterium]